MLHISGNYYTGLDAPVFSRATYGLLAADVHNVVESLKNDEGLKKLLKIVYDALANGNAERKKK
jgi:hypothetical protein